MTDQSEHGRDVNVVAGLSEASDNDVTPYGTGSSSGDSTAETIKEQSAEVGKQAADAGQRVASAAKEEAQAVVSEATDKARDLLGETRIQLLDQLSTQQHALASVVRSLADELHEMADPSGSARSSFARGEETGNQSRANGVAGQAVRQISAQASEVASWLEQREPGDVVDEVTRFARLRPGLFLVLAGAAGLLAGRLTRGLEGAGQDQGGISTPSPDSDANPGGSSAGSRYPSGQPVVPVETYPESALPTGASPTGGGSAVRGGDVGSAWEHQA